jgi:DNA-binding CsgD family transcriptional regulator
MTRTELLELQRRVWDWLSDGYSIMEIAKELRLGAETVYRYANSQKKNYLDSKDLSDSDKDIHPRDITRMALAGKVALCVMLGHTEKTIATLIGYSQPYVNRLKKMSEVWGDTGIKIELTGDAYNCDGEKIPLGVYTVTKMERFHVWLDPSNGGKYHTVNAEQLRNRNTIISTHLTKISRENT